MSEIIETIWMNPSMGCIGIQLLKNEFEHKILISTVDGNDKEMDEVFIKDWGVKLSFEQVEKMYFHMKNQPPKAQ